MNKGPSSLASNYMNWCKYLEFVNPNQTRLQADSHQIFPLLNELVSTAELQSMCEDGGCELSHHAEDVVIQSFCKLILRRHAFSRPNYYKIQHYNSSSFHKYNTLNCDPLRQLPIDAQYPFSSSKQRNRLVSGRH